MKPSSKSKPQPERWRLYRFSGIPVAAQKIEVSDKGRVRSNTQQSRGRVLNGSLTEGYRKISLRYITPRSRAGEQLFLKNKAALASELSALKEGERRLIEMKKRKLASASSFMQSLKRRKEVYEKNKSKYKINLLAEERKRTTFPGALVHRMVADTFCRKPSAKHTFVIHLDFNKLNNAASNLAWVTKEQMEAHQQKSPYVKAARKALIGKRSGTYALNESRVKSIKRLLSRKKATKESIAKSFGISSTQVKRIERGENWGDVKI